MWLRARNCSQGEIASAFWRRYESDSSEDDVEGRGEPAGVEAGVASRL